MKILFALNHPAHYHLFKHTSSELRKQGHNTVFVIKNKDMLADLIRSNNEDFHILTQKRVGHGKVSVFAKGLLDLIIQDYRLFVFCKRYKPDLMIGTDYCITHVGKTMGIDSLVFNEDDYFINKFFCNLAYPFATAIVSPFVCDVGKYVYKKIGYNGYQKLAYLHPSRFKPDKNIVNKYIDSSNKYFLIRLVRFAAGHDVEMNHSGINLKLIQEICSILEQHGNIFISNEINLPDHMQKYLIRIDPKDIHHIMAFADIFIADSQSMIVESAMLGTPCIRFNSFVGKISVLEELQDKYGLSIGVHVSHQKELIIQIKSLLSQTNLKSEYIARRERMLKDKIDLTKYIVWLINKYQENRKALINNSYLEDEFKNETNDGH